jgi:hypothetical protein
MTPPEGTLVSQLTTTEIAWLPSLLPAVVVPVAKAHLRTYHCPTHTIAVVKTPPAPIPNPRPCAKNIW